MDVVEVGGRGKRVEDCERGSLTESVKGVNNTGGITGKSYGFLLEKRSWGEQGRRRRRRGETERGG
jgi:hypothetical protein